MCMICFYGYLDIMVYILVLGFLEDNYIFEVLDLEIFSFFVYCVVCILSQFSFYIFFKCGENLYSSFCINWIIGRKNLNIDCIFIILFFIIIVFLQIIFLLKQVFNRFFEKSYLIVI